MERLKKLDNILREEFTKARETPHLFSELGLNYDPFSPDLPLKDEKFFYWREEVIVNVVQRIGYNLGKLVEATTRDVVTSRQMMKNLLIIGPRGVGKSTIAAWLAKNMVNIPFFQELNDVVLVYLNFKDWNQQSDTTRATLSSIITSPRVKIPTSFEQCLSMTKGMDDAIFITILDNIEFYLRRYEKLDPLLRLLDYLQQFNNLILFFLDGRTYLSVITHPQHILSRMILENSQQIPVWIPLWTPMELEELVLQRFPTNFFEDYVLSKSELKQLANNTLYLPLWTLKALKDLSYMSQPLEYSILSEKQLMSYLTLNTLDISTYLVKWAIYKKDTSARQQQKGKEAFISVFDDILSKKRILLLLEVFLRQELLELGIQTSLDEANIGFKASYLAKKLGIDISTVSYHLKAIQNISLETHHFSLLVTKFDPKDGRSKIFSLEEPIKTAIETLLLLHPIAKDHVNLPAESESLVLYKEVW